MINNSGNNNLSCGFCYKGLCLSLSCLIGTKYSTPYKLKAEKVTADGFRGSDHALLALRQKEQGGRAWRRKLLSPRWPGSRERGEGWVENRTLLGSTLGTTFHQALPPHTTFSHEVLRGQHPRDPMTQSPLNMRLVGDILGLRDCKASNRQVGAPAYSLSSC